MGNVVRIGDKLDCGSRAAEGAGSVLANGLPISTQVYKRTTGHECNPASYFIGPWTGSVFVEGAVVATDGNRFGPATKQERHRCTKLKEGHQGEAFEKSPNVFFDK